MDISVIGASGGCGREIVTQLVRDGVLGRRELLQLVGGNPVSSRPSYLHGLRADLQDAYAESIPELDVTDAPENVVGDIVVMAAGATFPTDAAATRDRLKRDDLARTNVPLFERFARAIALNRQHHPPLVIVVSNPVELGVHIFSRHLPRGQVLGMGAFSDSLRFRWEIASQLGLSRQRVHACMIGEHGIGMVPVWSGVRIHGLQGGELAQTIQRLRGGLSAADYPDRLLREHHEMMEAMMTDPVGGPVRCLQRLAQLPPDLRVALKPFPVHYSHAKTIASTAASAVELVKAFCEGRSVEVCAQYQHGGEYDLWGPIGNRVILEGSVRRIVPPNDLSDGEMELLRSSDRRCRGKLKEWLS